MVTPGPLSVCLTQVPACGVGRGTPADYSGLVQVRRRDQSSGQRAVPKDRRTDQWGPQNRRHEGDGWRKKSPFERIQKAVTIKEKDKLDFIEILGKPGRKYLPSKNLRKDQYPEYIKNFYNSVIGRQLNKKGGGF